MTLPALAITRSGTVPSSILMDEILMLSPGKRSLSVTTMPMARPISRMPGQPATAAPRLYARRASRK